MTRSKTCTPNCSINGCGSCLSPTSCSNCSVGFQLIANSTVCEPILCNISNCSVCITTTACGVCASGYSVGSDGICLESCLIAYCLSCISGKCVTCIDGFSIYQGGLGCYPICGWNSMIVNGSCISCTSIIDNCATCDSSS